MKSLNQEQLTALLNVARKYSEADYLLVLMAYQHGLRVTELVGLTAANVVDDHLYVVRQKNSNPTRHPLFANERELVRQRVAASDGGRLFSMSRWTVRRRLQEFCAEAGVPCHLGHPHALRHSCGRLAYLGGAGLPEIQKFLGHKSISSTGIYLEASESEASASVMSALSPAVKSSAAAGGQ